MKQTAVEYLLKELSAILGALKTEPMQDLLLVDAIKQAKEIEKYQIIDAFEEGISDEASQQNTTPQQYYHKKYGGKDAE
jgi:hypothetical protein